MATQSIPTGLQTIPLASIIPNVNNPRKHFDQAALKELAKSIESHGVRQPILVRPDPFESKNFELIVGERRWRASKLAGKKDIPAIVDVLSDREALEVMVIENQQRQDVSPLEEARGYQALMNLGADNGTAAHTVESIAAKVGKSVGYVYARLKLIALIPAAAEALEGNHITPGHAILIARLQPIDQVRGLDACFHAYGNDRELKKLDPEKVKLAELHDEGESRLLPEKTLREWIQENINLRLKDVPWKLEDANLVPEAGPCSTCQKRSVSNPGLFADLAVKGEDTCFDAACFQEKRKAFVQITIQADKAIVASAEKAGDEPKEILLQLSDLHDWNPPKPDQATYRAGQWLPAKPGSCVNTRMGILVRGEEAGKRKSVCVDQSCKVHKHTLKAARSGGSGGGTDYAAEEFNRHKGSIRDAKKAIARRALVREIISGVGVKLPLALLRAVVDDQVRTDWEIGAVATLGLLGLKSDKPCGKLKELVDKGSETILNKLLIADLLEVTQHGNDKTEREEISALAKAVGIKNPHGVLTREDDRVNKLQACRECGCTEETACEFYNEGNSKRLACSWKELDLCSNPKCMARAKSQTSAKSKKGK
jgi:ParB family transcriptional regulator, chromosome partitioning protein